MPTTNDFWEFILAVEDAYAVRRKTIMQQFSLTAAEVDILLFLANNPEFDTAAQIAKLRRIPKSQISLSVASLCRAGLLTGRHAPNDRKSVHLLPTDAAAPVIEAGRGVQEEFAETLFSGFSDAEKAEFSRLHAKIADNISLERKDNA